MFISRKAPAEGFDPASVSIGIIAADVSTLVTTIKMCDKGIEPFEYGMYRIIKCSGKTVAISVAISSVPHNISAMASKMEYDFPNMEFIASLGVGRGIIPGKESDAILTQKELFENTKNELLIKEKECEIAQGKRTLKETELKATDDKESPTQDVTKLKIIRAKRKEFFDADLDYTDKQIQFSEVKNKMDELKQNMDRLASQTLKTSTEDKKDVQLELGDVVVSSKVVRISQVTGEIFDSSYLQMPSTDWLNAAKGVEQKSIVEATTDMLHQFPENKQEAWKNPKGSESTRNPRVFESIIAGSDEYGMDFDKINSACKKVGALCFDQSAIGLTVGHTKYIIIRGIGAQTNKSMIEGKWESYAALNAAGFLRCVLEHISPAPKLHRKAGGYF